MSFIPIWRNASYINPSQITINYQRLAPCCLLLPLWIPALEQVVLQPQSSRHFHWISLCCQENWTRHIPQWPWETDNWMSLSNKYDTSQYGLPSFLHLCSCHRRDQTSPDLILSCLSASQPRCKLRLSSQGGQILQLWWPPPCQGRGWSRHPCQRQSEQMF